MAEPQNSSLLIDHLFRHYWGRAVAGLVRQFGLQFLDNIEDAVQESLLAALKSWPLRGIPQNAEGWLYSVARNRLIDELRGFRSRRDQNATNDILHELPQLLENDNPRFRLEIADDVLRMMVICCNPEISMESRSALTLQVVCGFNSKEIASAYLCSADTIAKRIERARKRILDAPDSALYPDIDQLDARIDSVLEVIYLLFNEGYSAYHHEELIRFELCAEALRLVRVLLSSRYGSLPVCRALAALLCFQSARLTSRQGNLGELVLLEDQDRALWDGQLIAEGMDNLEQAATGKSLSRYHLEAAIAACHISAKSYSDTDWQQIVYYYDRLIEIQPGLMVQLNRLVAVSMIEGPRAALDEIEENQALRSLDKHHQCEAVIASLYHRLGDIASASKHYQSAFETATNPRVRDFLLSRIAECH